MQRFNGKIALVTGGRGGIGKAIALRLHREGARVFTAQRSEDSDLESIPADFSDLDTPARVVSDVIAKAGRLDILVNNAGIMQDASIEDTDVETWQHSLAINLTAPFLTIKAALPHLRKTRGSIVNIGSIEGLACNPQHAAYSAAKAGLHGLTRAVAVDHGVDGIRCNAVAPGWIETELNRSYIEKSASPEIFREAISALHPLRRTGDPEDVAALVAFLTSQESGFITGEIYRVDGGRMAKLPLP